MRRRKKSRFKVRFPYSDFIWSATYHFIHRGFKLTHLDDIAMDTEIAKGTIYRYVLGKEALFGQVMRFADYPKRLRPPQYRPIMAPADDDLRTDATKRLDVARTLPRVNLEPPARPLLAARAEYRSALEEIYRHLRSNSTAIRLIERCSSDHPALAGMELDPKRLPAIDLLTRFLDLHRQHLPRRQKSANIAQVSVEVMVYFAVYRDWRREQHSFTDSWLRPLVARMLAAGALRPSPSGTTVPPPPEAGPTPESAPIDPPPRDCQT